MTPILSRYWQRAAGGLFLLAIIAGAFLVWGDTPRPAAPTRDEPVRQEAEAGIGLTPQQRQAAGIVVEPLREQPLARAFRAPGEVRANDYTTYVVASRIGATVIRRHASLGDRVRKGQVLITLFSAEMAEAQSAYYLAERDYARYSQLGTRSISAMQIEQANAKRHEARGKLESFGLPPAEIAAIAQHGMPAGRTGQFQLLAQRDGKITLDDFRAGQVVESGKALFEISDTSRLWVEARVSPVQASEIASKLARVFVDGRARPGNVIQIGDRLDEATRTIGVRIEIDNADGHLKPGQFVDVELEAKARPVIAVPTAAVLRDSGGDWTVYVETARNRFVPRKVQLLYGTGGNSVISGIAAGTPVVITGAFFVRSEGEKASFGEE